MPGHKPGYVRCQILRGPSSDGGNRGCASVTNFSGSTLGDAEDDFVTWQFGLLAPHQSIEVRATPEGFLASLFSEGRYIWRGVPHIGNRPKVRLIGRDFDLALLITFIKLPLRKLDRLAEIVEEE
ncbi:hypothetical protein D3C81_1887850 [compost metagenome]